MVHTFSEFGDVGLGFAQPETSDDPIFGEEELLGDGEDEEP